MRLSIHLTLRTAECFTALVCEVDHSNVTQCTFSNVIVLNNPAVYSISVRRVPDIVLHLQCWNGLNLVQW